MDSTSENITPALGRLLDGPYSELAQELLKSQDAEYLRAVAIALLMRLGEG